MKQQGVFRLEPVSEHKGTLQVINTNLRRQHLCSFQTPDSDADELNNALCSLSAKDTVFFVVLKAKPKSVKKEEAKLLAEERKTR